jgi:hypothetical protein
VFVKQGRRIVFAPCDIDPFPIIIRRCGVRICC